MSELRLDGWPHYNTWEHSAALLDLYRRRARNEALEMGCAAQAAEILQSIARPGDSLLDVGCGPGHFWHSLRKRGIDLDYRGIDATARFIDIGKAELAPFGFDLARLLAGRIEDMNGSFDHVLCMNVLTYLDNYHRPLERMLAMARKSVILRESIKDGVEYRYVVDEYLDQARLRVHVNAYDRSDVFRLIAGLGFAPAEILDRRSGGAPEMSIGYPHYWTFVVARRT